jgi:hypothetical protein
MLILQAVRASVARAAFFSFSIRGGAERVVPV